MEVNNSPEIVLGAELQRIMKKSKCLSILCSILKEHLFLIDRNPDMVKSPLGNL